jgi:flagellar biosynthesis chaperone FliJ
MGKRIQGNTKMSEHEATIRDLQTTVDELRTLLMNTKEMWFKANQDRADWQDLAERAIAQIEEWRSLCDTWQTRYNQLLGGN